MNSNITPLGQMRIYGCGGFGVNIAKTFAPAAGGVEPGYAQTHPVYVDTSRSNLHDDRVDPEAVYLLEDIDGSGKVRKSNSSEISRHVKPLLQKYPEADLNVVIFSASGGSGSVFGPLLMRELLERGATVVGVVVGSDESDITADNTIKTLKSLEVIAEKAKAPAVIFFEMNEPGIRRSEIDSRCRDVIGRLSILASRQNLELDTRDIGNWTHFNRSTSIGPRLALLDVYTTNEAANEAVNPIAIASLYASPDDEPITAEPEYSTVGYVKADKDGNPIAKHFVNTHFVITLGGVPVIYKRMERKISEQAQKRAGRVVHDRIADAGEADDSGLVF